MSDEALHPNNTSSTASGREESFFFVNGQWELVHTYQRDPLQCRFLAALKEKQLLGARDPVLDRVIFPPRSLFEESFAELSELVPVGPGGVIRTLACPARPQTGRPASVVVFVQLDGAQTAAAGQLRGQGVESAEPLSLIGARCRAVFKPEPAGDWNDYWYELEG